MQSSIMAISAYINTNSAKHFPFLNILYSIFCTFFDDGHSDWCEVMPHCSFDLHFCNNEQCWVSFHVFIGHLYVIFGEMSIYMLCPLFDWVVVFLVLSCVSCVPVFFIVLWQSSDLKTIWCPFYIGIVCRGQWLQINIETETFRIAV